MILQDKKLPCLKCGSETLHFYTFKRKRGFRLIETNVALNYSQVPCCEDCSPKFNRRNYAKIDKRSNLLMVSPFATNGWIPYDLWITNITMNKEFIWDKHIKISSSTQRSHTRGMIIITGLSLLITIIGIFTFNMALLIFGLVIFAPIGLLILNIRTKSKKDKVIVDFKDSTEKKESWQSRIH